MITIQCKYNSVLILRAGQLGTLVKYTSRLEEDKLVSNWTNLFRTSNKYCLNVTEGLFAWTGPIVCLSPFSVMLWIRSNYLFLSEARYSLLLKHGILKKLVTLIRTSVYTLYLGHGLNNKLVIVPLLNVSIIWMFGIQIPTVFRSVCY